MQIEQSIEKGEVLFTGTFMLKIVEVQDMFTLSPEINNMNMTK